MAKEKDGIHSQNKSEVYPRRITGPMVRAFSEFKRKTLKILTKPVTEYSSGGLQKFTKTRKSVSHPVIKLLILWYRWELNYLKRENRAATQYFSSDKSFQPIYFIRLMQLEGKILLPWSSSTEHAQYLLHFDVLHYGTNAWNLEIFCLIWSQTSTLFFKPIYTHSLFKEWPLAVKDTGKVTMFIFHKKYKNVLHKKKSNTHKTQTTKTIKSLNLP